MKEIIYIHIHTHTHTHTHTHNLFILHNIPFDNQGSEINKNDIFLRFDTLSFTKTFFLLPYVSCMHLLFYFVLFTKIKKEYGTSF